MFSILLAYEEEKGAVWLPLMLLSSTESGSLNRKDFSTHGSFSLQAAALHTVSNGREGGASMDSPLAHVSFPPLKIIYMGLLPSHQGWLYS